MKRVIVSRHPAAVEFIRSAAPEFTDAEVLSSATEADVLDRVVAGNLPLHLAALAAEVIAVEFDGEPPRGAEYTAADMAAAGARLRRYRVTAYSVRAGKPIPPEEDEVRAFAAAAFASAAETARPAAEVAAEYGYTVPPELSELPLKRIHSAQKRYVYASKSGAVFSLLRFGRQGGFSRMDTRRAAARLLPLERLSRLGIKPDYYR